LVSIVYPSPLKPNSEAVKWVAGKHSFVFICFSNFHAKTGTDEGRNDVSACTINVFFIESRRIQSWRTSQSVDLRGDSW
jgi:hypothetical protein